ncbi:MAG: ATP-binding protein [Candidatus Woesearchaeota archaeon]
MRIEELYLKNIRSYSENTISFPKGSSLLMGDIGSGKSTILKAIEFALFGTQRGSLEAHTLLRKGSDEALVRLTVTLGTKQIEIQRSLKGSQQTGGHIIIDGVKEVLMPTELKARMLELLGYPNTAVFRYSLYAPQEAMKEIILEKPDVRLNILRELFGIDSYKKMQENAILINRNLKQQAIFKEGQLKDLPDQEEILKQKESIIQELEFSLKKAEAQRDELQEKHTAIHASFESVKIQKQEQVFIKESIEKAKQDLDIFKKKITLSEKTSIETKNKISDLENDCAKIHLTDGDLTAVTKQKETMLETYNENVSKKNTLLEKKSILEKNTLEVSDSSKELETALKELHDLEEKQKYMLDKKVLVEKLQQQKHTLHSKLNDKTKDLENIASLDVCPTCSQKVTDDHKHACKKSLEDFKLELDNKIATLEKTIAQNVYEEVDLSKQIVLVSTLKERVTKEKEQQQKIAQNKKDLESIEKELQLLNEFDFDYYKESIGRLKEKEKILQANEVLKEKKKGIESEITSLQKYYAELESNILEYRQSLEKTNIALKQLQEKFKPEIEVLFAESKQKFEASLKLFEEAKEQYVTLKERFARENDVIATLHKTIQEKKAVQKELIWNKQFSAWINTFFIPVLSEIEKTVLLQIQIESSKKFSEWFNLLIEDDSIAVTIDDQFSPYIQQNGYDIDISSLSGGERTSVALAYRLALNKVVNDFIPSIQTKDVLILDEPTEGFSTQQLDRVRIVLETLRVAQLIVVSHEPKMEGFVDSVLEVIKENHVSTVNTLS